MSTRPQSLHEIIIESADAGISIQREDGSLPPTQNGVYAEDETPMRNTSKWVRIFLKAYQITQSDKFSKAARSAAEYLTTDKLRPDEATFYSRNVPKKSKCDGLVGQSAAIKALTESGKLLDETKYRRLAKEVFEIHPQSKSFGLWEAVEIDGGYLSYDRTFNHQLFFAESASYLAKNDESVQNSLSLFIEKLPANVKFRKNGLVRHYVYPPVQNTLAEVLSNRRHWPLLRNYVTSPYYRLSSKRYQKELGYYPSIISAMATLKRNLPDHSILDTSFQERIMKFTYTDEFVEQVKTRKSPYGSMLPGIKYANALSVFADTNPQDLRKWIEYDINRTYDPETGMLTRNAVDPHFQASSIVAALELPNVELDIQV